MTRDTRRSVTSIERLTSLDRSVAPVAVAAALRLAPTPTATFPMDAIDAAIDYLRYP